LPTRRWIDAEKPRDVSVIAKLRVCVTELDIFWNRTSVLRGDNTIYQIN